MKAILLTRLFQLLKVYLLDVVRSCLAPVLNVDLDLAFRELKSRVDLFA